MISCLQCFTNIPPKKNALTWLELSMTQSLFFFTASYHTPQHSISLIIEKFISFSLWVACRSGIGPTGHRKTCIRPSACTAGSPCCSFSINRCSRLRSFSSLPELSPRLPGIRIRFGRVFSEWCFPAWGRNLGLAFFWAPTACWVSLEKKIVEWVAVRSFRLRPFRFRWSSSCLATDQTTEAVLSAVQYRMGYSIP